MEKNQNPEKRTSRTPHLRKPLADLTNTTPSATPAILKPIISTREGSRSSARLARGGLENHDENSTPTLRAKEISANSDGDAVTVDRASSVVYTRRRKAGKKDKGKAVASAVASSCPPIGRIRTIKGKLNLDDNEFDLPEEISVPCRKLKKRRYTMPGRPPVLPQDFVEEQKAYFAEVDAFELPEEYASESDSE